MSDKLLHIRVSRRTREQMEALIEGGLYNNIAEITREGIRSVLLKYKDEVRRKDEE